MKKTALIQLNSEVVIHKPVGILILINQSNGLFSLLKLSSTVQVRKTLYCKLSFFMKDCTRIQFCIANLFDIALPAALALIPNVAFIVGYIQISFVYDVP